MHTYNLSVVISTKNSASYIGETLEEVARSLKDNITSFEIVVVNDGGDAATKTEVIAFKEKFQHLTYIELAKYYGQQEAVQEGIYHSEGKYIVTFDDDLQFKAHEILRLYHRISEEQLLAVNGYSTSKKHRGAYGWISIWISFLLETVFFREYCDIHYFTSLKIFNAELLANYREKGANNIYFFWDFKPKDMTFIIVDHHYRTKGVSGYNLWAYIKFFRHIIVKMVSKIFKIALFFWMFIAFLKIQTSVFLMGIGFLLICLMSCHLYLKYLKRKIAVVKEVIK